MSSPQPILEAVRRMLNENGVIYTELHHEPTRTSEDSARVRGESMRIGGKALVMKGDEQYALFVLPADCKSVSSAIRKELGYRKMRFATPEELMSLTGLVPGSVPPFGRPILPFELYLDELIPRNPRIAFNAGSLTDSIILEMSDYLKLARPARVFSFAAESEA
ncbi:MAG: YbaK/EbsC family protein [Planctomycetaceae bacterium]